MVKTRMDRHVILLIEDDADAAEDFIDRLKRLEYSCLHVTNQQDAQAVVEQGGFCCMLIDRQILSKPDSIRAHLAVGQETLLTARATFPGRDEHDKHLLQILAMSALFTRPSEVELAMQEGADGCILKPLSQNKISIEEKIRLALKHSGRLRSHTGCEAATARARLRTD